MLPFQRRVAEVLVTAAVVNPVGAAQAMALPARMTEAVAPLPVRISKELSDPTNTGV